MKFSVSDHPRIVQDSAIMGGVPVIKGTRIPVFIILEILEGGHNILRLIPRIFKLQFTLLQILR